MNLTIKLKDPKYCDGCPCLDYFFDLEGREEVACSLYFVKPEIIDICHIKRPTKCIKGNGL